MKFSCSYDSKWDLSAFVAKNAFLSLARAGLFFIKSEESNSSWARD